MNREREIDISVWPLITKLHEVMECHDGMQTIVSYATTHSQIYTTNMQECLKKFRSYSHDFVDSIYNLMNTLDSKFFTNEIIITLIPQIKNLIENSEEIKQPYSLNHLSINPSSQTINYLNKICEFALLFEKLIIDFYKQQGTSAPSLWPQNLPKRHEILKLFHPELSA